MDFKSALASIATPKTEASNQAEVITDFTQASTKPGFMALAQTIQRLELDGDKVRTFALHSKPAFGFLGTRDWIDGESGEKTSSTTLIIALEDQKVTEAFNIRQRPDGSLWSAKLGGKQGDPKSPALKKMEEYVEQTVLPLFAEDIAEAMKAGKVSKVSGGGAGLLSLFNS